MEIKKSNNFMLTTLLPEIDKLKGEVCIKYKHDNLGVEISGKHVDLETISMFALGSLFDIYEHTHGTVMFTKAFKECVEELNKRVERDLKEMEEDNGKL